MVIYLFLKIQTFFYYAFLSGGHTFWDTIAVEERILLVYRNEILLTNVTVQSKQEPPTIMMIAGGSMTLKYYFMIRNKMHLPKI